MMDEVGEQNVIQVVTDNASNYVKAGKLLAAMRPQLYWTPCAARCIDLMLEDIGNLERVKSCLKMAMFMNAHGASEPAYPTRASTSRGSVHSSTSAPKGKGDAHTFTFSSKAYELIHEDYKEDIRLFEDDGVNEELGIDVDDDKDDKNDFYFSFGGVKDTKLSMLTFDLLLIIKK
nr:uncharacterized protein [Tanacetum cinerariifolium]